MQLKQDTEPEWYFCINEIRAVAIKGLQVLKPKQIPTFDAPALNNLSRYPIFVREWKGSVMPGHSEDWIMANLSLHVPREQKKLETMKSSKEMITHLDKVSPTRRWWSPGDGCLRDHEVDSTQRGHASGPTGVIDEPRETDTYKRIINIDLRFLLQTYHELLSSLSFKN